MLLSWFIINLYKQSYRFSNIIFTIPLDEAEEIESLIDNLLQMIRKNLTDSQIIHEIESQKIMQKKKKREKAKAQKVFRSALMGRYRRNLIFLFIGTLPILILIASFILVFFFNSQARLNRIKKEQKQMEYAFDMMYLQNCLMNEVEEFTIRNGKSTYRNNDPFEEYKKDLEKYSADLYLEQLKDENGELTPDEVRILFNFPCHELAPAIAGLGTVNIITNCNSYSKNKTVGLIDLISNNALLFMSIRDDYAKLPKLKPYLQVFLGRLLQANTRLEITIGMMYMSWNLSLKYLIEQIDLVKKEGAILTGIAIGVGLFIGTIAWGWVLMTILRKPKERDQILLLIPTKTLLANRYIRKYVLDNAKGKLDNYRILL